MYFMTNMKGCKIDSRVEIESKAGQWGLRENGVSRFV